MRPGSEESRANIWLPSEPLGFQVIQSDKICQQEAPLRPQGILEGCGTGLNSC
jgi:hypothetical protein